MYKALEKAFFQNPNSEIFFSSNIIRLVTITMKGHIKLSANCAKNNKGHNNQVLVCAQSV